MSVEGKCCSCYLLSQLLTFHLIRWVEKGGLGSLFIHAKFDFSKIKFINLYSLKIISLNFRSRKNILIQELICDYLQTEYEFYSWGHFLKLEWSPIACCFIVYMYNSWNKQKSNSLHINIYMQEALSPLFVILNIHPV